MSYTPSRWLLIPLLDTLINKSQQGFDMNFWRRWTDMRSLCLRITRVRPLALIKRRFSLKFALWLVLNFLCAIGSLRFLQAGDTHFTSTVNFLVFEDSRGKREFWYLVRLGLFETGQVTQICFLYSATAYLTSHLDLRRPYTNLRSMTSSNKITIQHCSVWALWWIACLSYTRECIVILHYVICRTSYLHQVILLPALVHWWLVAIIDFLRTIKNRRSSDLLSTGFASRWN